MSAQSKARPRIWLCILLGIVLFFGSGIAIAYFNTDVDMQGAQARLYAFITGEEGAHPANYAIPFSIGVAIGSLAFLQPPKSKDPSPIQLKFEEYQKEVAESKAQSAKAK